MRILSLYSTVTRSLLLLIIWTPLTSSFLDYFAVNIHNIPNPLHHLYHYSPPSSTFLHILILIRDSEFDCSWLGSVFVRLCSVQTFTIIIPSPSIMIVGAYRLCLHLLLAVRQFSAHGIRVYRKNRPNTPDGRVSTRFDPHHHHHPLSALRHYAMLLLLHCIIVKLDRRSSCSSNLTTAQASTNALRGSSPSRLCARTKELCLPLMN